MKNGSEWTGNEFMLFFWHGICIVLVNYIFSITQIKI